MSAARNTSADDIAKRSERADMIRSTMRVLAADPTATGATLILPSGEILTISADDARAMYSSGAPRKAGRA